MSNMKQHIEMFNKANAVVPSPYSLSTYQYMEPNFQLPEPASLWFWTFFRFQSLLCAWTRQAGSARQLRHTLLSLK